jgi:hypothetical protein
MILSLFQTGEDGFWEEELDFAGILEEEEWCATTSLVGAMGRMELDKVEEGVAGMEGEEGMGGGRRRGRREEYVERQREMRKERSQRIRERKRELLRRVVAGDITQEEMVREMVGRSVQAEERKKEREVKKAEKNREKRERLKANRKARREATGVKMVGGTAVTAGGVAVPAVVPELNEPVLGDMLRRLGELEVGVQRKVDEGVAEGVKAGLEKADGVWEERVRCERVRHEAEMREVQREVGDLREKLDRTGRGREHDGRNYGRTKYVTNKMDERYNRRTGHNNNNNNNNNHNYHKYGGAPRGSLPAVRGRLVRPDVKVVAGRRVEVTGPARRASPGPVGGAPTSSPDPSRTDFRIRERGVARVTEMLGGGR